MFRGKLKILGLAAALLASTAVCASARAEEAPDFSDTLTGNWGGKRASLYESGVSLEAAYKLGLWKNFSGGIQRGSSGVDNLDLKLTLDGEKLYGVPGSTAFIYLLNNMGGQPGGKYVGAAGGTDNIEVPEQTAKLYEAWLEQAFADGKLSLRAGLYDLNSEFYVTDASGLFLNPTYGIGTEFAATGQNGPSIFPTTSLAARLLVQPSERTYAQVAVLDGAPGDTNNANGTHVRLGGKDGALLAAEAGCRDDDWGHYGVGAWRYTARDDDWDGTGSHHNGGVYLIGERTLYSHANDPDRKIDGFARFGVANGDVSQFSHSWSAGFVYTGVFEADKEGQMGLAVSQAVNSGAYRRSVAASDKRETQIELTYSTMPLPWLTVQPDLQYTINPGTDPALSNATTAGVRVVINF